MHIFYGFVHKSRFYEEKYRYFGIGKWYECGEYHPLFSGKKVSFRGFGTDEPEGCLCIGTCSRIGSTLLFFPKDEWEHGGAILSVLEEHGVDFVVLAGFLARVPEAILHVYPGRIINIHPSLLPKFGGKGMYGNRVHEAVLAAGEVESGITIHYINEHYDEGDVIRQVRCPVLPEDTPEELACRIHALEYEVYPEVIEQLLSEIG